MQWYEAEVAALVERLGSEPTPNPTVFLGSSSLRLWTSIAADLNDPSVVNAGFGGSTLAACDFFFDRIVPPLGPAALLVYAGDNDLGDGRPPDAVIASFRELRAKVDRSCGPIPFGFISIKPSPARADLIDSTRRTNAAICADITRRPHGFFVSVFDAMLRDGKPRPELYLPDGLHLNAAGYELWTQLLLPFRSRWSNGTAATAFSERSAP
jgi:lysophospholipase L1-like esterase